MPHQSAEVPRLLRSRNILHGIKLGRLAEEIFFLIPTSSDDGFGKDDGHRDSIGLLPLVRFSVVVHSERNLKSARCATSTFASLANSLKAEGASLQMPVAIGQLQASVRFSSEPCKSTHFWPARLPRSYSRQQLARSTSPLPAGAWSSLFKWSGCPKALCCILQFFLILCSLFQAMCKVSSG